MSLQPCRECASRVSTEAPFCPHCGVPDPTRGTGADEPGLPDPAASPPDADRETAAWRYIQGELQQGPRTRSQLLELLRSGEISPETRVKSDAMPYWMPVKMVPELRA